MNKRVFNDKSLEHLFDDGNAFKIAKNLEGKIYRDYANRKTKQFFFRGSSYFIKYHGPVGWREILKNFIQLIIVRIKFLISKTVDRLPEELFELEELDLHEVLAQRLYR